MVFVLPNINRQKEGKEFLMKKVQKFPSLKIVGTNIWPGICYLLNLLNGFHNLARKSARC